MGFYFWVRVFKGRERTREKCWTQKAHKLKYPRYNIMSSFWTPRLVLAYDILYLDSSINKTEKWWVSNYLGQHPSEMNNFAPPSATLLNTVCVQETGSSLFLHYQCSSRKQVNEEMAGSFIRCKAESGAPCGQARGGAGLAQLLVSSSSHLLSWHLWVGHDRCSYTWWLVTWTGISRAQLEVCLDHMFAFAHSPFVGWLVS